MVVNDANEILLTWFNGGAAGFHPGWSLPGVGVEFDEDIESAAVREAHEETGYLVELGSLLAMHHFTAPFSRRTGRPFRAQRFIFDATIVGGHLGAIEEGGTIEFARWVARPDFPLHDGVAHSKEQGASLAPSFPLQPMRNP